MPRSFYLPATIICFAIAVLAFSGLVLEDDLIGRSIFGGAWTILGVIWLAHYLRRSKMG